MQYWLCKSEPSSYSIDDLMRDGRTLWTGVRNYQARNFMRDTMREGDRIFFYHSAVAEPAIVGEGEVCSVPQVDPTALDPQSLYYDPRSTKEAPRWWCVEICFKKKYIHPHTLSELRKHPRLSDLLALRAGNRLSITPVTPAHATLLTRSGV